MRTATAVVRLVQKHIRRDNARRQSISPFCDDVGQRPAHVVVRNVYTARLVELHSLADEVDHEIDKPNHRNETCITKKLRAAVDSERGESHSHDDRQYTQGGSGFALRFLAVRSPHS